MVFKSRLSNFCFFEILVSKIKSSVSKYVVLCMKSQKIICFGEILWDLFPEGKKLGGAPFNVASSLHDLGAHVGFISRIGQDKLGDELLQQVKKKGINTDHIQTDAKHETGKVLIRLNEKGSAEYEIKPNQAWDFIEVTSEAIALTSNADALIFGSLACRGKSYEALCFLMEHAAFSVFDLNLRPPFFTYTLLEELMQNANMLKFNDEELYQIAEMMGSPYHSMDQHILYLSKRTNTEMICVTKGMFGAVLFSRGKWFFNSGYQVEVQDTVGAGDSFLATLIYHILQETPLQQAVDRACAMGAIVAGSHGANPTISPKDLDAFMGNELEH